MHCMHMMDVVEPKECSHDSIIFWPLLAALLALSLLSFSCHLSDFQGRIISFLPWPWFYNLGNWRNEIKPGATCGQRNEGYPPFLCSFTVLTSTLSQRKWNYYKQVGIFLKSICYPSHYQAILCMHTITK